MDTLPLLQSKHLGTRASHGNTTEEFCGSTAGAKFSTLRTPHNGHCHKTAASDVAEVEVVPGSVHDMPSLRRLGCGVEKQPMLSSKVVDRLIGPAGDTGETCDVCGSAAIDKAEPGDNSRQLGLAHVMASATGSTSPSLFRKSERRGAGSDFERRKTGAPTV